MIFYELCCCNRLEVKCNSINLALAFTATLVRTLRELGFGAKVIIECPLPNAFSHPSVLAMCSSSARVYHGQLTLCTETQLDEPGEHETNTKTILVSERRARENVWANVFLQGFIKNVDECFIDVRMSRGIVAVIRGSEAELYRISHGALRPDMPEDMMSILEILSSSDAMPMKVLMRSLKNYVDRARLIEVIGLLRELKIVDVDRGQVILRRRIRIARD